MNNNPDGVGVRLLPTDQVGAADPWIKIEPGCEMPEPGLPVLLAAAGHYIVAWWTGNHWRDHMGRLNGSPTHYAVMRTPEAND